MSESVGQKGSVKRASELLGVPVAGATQIENAGGVTRSMFDLRKAGLGLAGRVVGLGAQKVVDARQSSGDAASSDPIPVPRHAVLAVTSDAVHIIPASDAGRMKKGTQPLTIPLSEIADVTLDERNVATGFVIGLRSGKSLSAETKRIGANRHNIEVLRLLQSSITP